MTDDEDKLDNLQENEAGIAWGRWRGRMLWDRGRKFLPQGSLYVRPSVRPPTHKKFFFQFQVNFVGYVYRGRRTWHMTASPFDTIQGQGHEGPKIRFWYSFALGLLFNIGSCAASFKRPLLSVDVSVCLSVYVSATLMLNISETKRFGDSYTIQNL